MGEDHVGFVTADGAADSVSKILPEAVYYNAVEAMAVLSEPRDEPGTIAELAGDGPDGMNFAGDLLKKRCAGSVEGKDLPFAADLRIGADNTAKAVGWASGTAIQSGDDVEYTQCSPNLTRFIEEMDYTNRLQPISNNE